MTWQWPWKRRKVHSSPPVDTGGKEARERAEEALADVRERRHKVVALRTILVRDMTENHYGDRVYELFRGGRA